MELTRIAGGDCGRDDCPTIFTTDKDTIAVKGYVIYIRRQRQVRRSSRSL